MSLYGPTAVERAMRIQEVILRAASGEITWMKAAHIIGCSDRTMRRWKTRYEKLGYDGLLDRRTQRPSPKRVPLQEVEKVLRLYRDRYDGFNVRHYHQKLREKHGVTLSYTFVKKALQEAGLVQRTRKRGRHHRRREPKPCFGEMLHIDGSSHAWLALKPELVLTLIVVLDDATSRMLYAQLWLEETTKAILTALRTVIAEHGLFMSLYTDRASWAFYTPQAGKKVNKTMLTQVGRALDRLGIEHIPAYSPQARGRSERVNLTLQDRLVNELREAGIDNIEAANRYIREVYCPDHDRNFAREPADPTSCFVSAHGAVLDDILCIEEDRTVSSDNTVQAGKKFLQIDKQKDRATCKGLSVKLREHLDGTYSVTRGVKILGRFDAHGRPLGKPASRSGKHHRAA
ncbi:MAG: ISNCY family transposase [Deltaproteobacteria bacterium]|nr:ISNCY family transposase [Deltaproteobacteria bacterium]